MQRRCRVFGVLSRELLARLWAAGAGPGDLGAPLTIDVDSTIVAVHGRAKQGAAFGYTKVRGYHPQLATCAQTGQVLMCRLTGHARAIYLLAETVDRSRQTHHLALTRRDSTRKSNLQPLNASRWSSVGASTTTYGEKSGQAVAGGPVRDPDRNLPSPLDFVTGKESREAAARRECQRRTTR